ncbi:MAG: DNA-formamidopyrimidine glycosylase family protein [Acidimicrobiia bacterium]
MPEILEVESFRIQAEVATGRVIESVYTPDDHYLKNVEARALNQLLPGQEVKEVRRIGKLLLLETTGLTLGLRFGMTGRLVADEQVPLDQLYFERYKDKPEWRRFGLTFVGGGSLVMSDPRRFGSVWLDPDTSKMGVDAFELTPDALQEILASSRAAVKTRLLDQSRIAGIGNLLVDEILWEAGINPRRPANSLSEGETAKLATVIPEILKILGERGGSHTGELYPHRNKGAVCPNDGTPLEHYTLSTRTTWWCPGHQH